MGVERDEVELPLVEQLKAMGWRHVPGKDLDRDDHSEVLLTRPLAAALRRINAHGGVDWLDDERIAMAIGDLQRIQAGGLLEANQTATSYLLSGVSVPGDPALHGGTREGTERLRSVAVPWEGERHPPETEEDGH